MAIASFYEVGIAIGRPISDPTEREQVEWWLSGVELIISGRLGAIASLNQEAVIFVEAETVAEKVRRSGTNESSITVSVDDGSVTRRYDNPASEADITDEWWALLGYRPPRAKSMRVTGGPILR